MSAVGVPTYLGAIGRLARLPLARMLLLSLGLHAAGVMIVQPRPYPPAPEVVVISARLMEKTDPASPDEVLPPPSPAPAEPAPAVSPESPPLPLPPSPAPAAESTVVNVPPIPAPPVVVAGEPEDKPAPPAPRPAPETKALPSVPVMVDAHWYEARQLDKQPRAAAPINPLYPAMARRDGIEGSVKLKLRVDEYGFVKEAEVEESDPPGVFDDSALDAFRQGRFQPAIKDGRPVRALIRIRVKYEIDDL